MFHGEGIQGDRIDSTTPGAKSNWVKTCLLLKKCVILVDASVPPHRKQSQDVGTLHEKHYKPMVVRYSGVSHVQAMGKLPSSVSNS